MRHYFFSIIICIGCQSCLTQKIDTTPYQGTAYYQQTVGQIQNYSPPKNQNQDTVQVGWAKVNITPEQSAPMAGYGKRKGKFFEQVHDSVWVRVFVFKTKSRKAAWITADLLIFPMSVTAQLQKLLAQKGYSLQNTYFTATHTHYSLGGWGKKPAGRIMAGKYNKQIVHTISNAIIQGIERAENTAEKALIGYQEISAPEFVYNRLTGQEENLDPFIRLLRFRHLTGKEAFLVTYAAHPTSVASNDLRLSGEYLGLLVQLLEKRMHLDMVAFGAGGVGSHGPKAPGTGYDKVTNLANGLADIIQDGIKEEGMAYKFDLQSAYFPVNLPKPQWRISSNRRLAPCLFYTVFGKYSSGLSMLKVGSVIMMGTPCDFSGELMPALTNYGIAHQQHVMVTSFNGSYIGYVTPEKYYNLKKYETRDMNFFGPYTGTYFQELLKLIILKASF